MAKHYDKQFKLDAVQYYHDHKNLGLQGCATNLGISQQTLSRWQKELRETGDIESRGSGNYASDEAKEIARLKRELRDAQDALEVLKKAINILGEYSCAMKSHFRKFGNQMSGSGNHLCKYTSLLA